MKRTFIAITILAFCLFIAACEESKTSQVTTDKPKTNINKEDVKKEIKETIATNTTDSAKAISTNTNPTKENTPYETTKTVKKETKPIVEKPKPKPKPRAKMVFDKKTYDYGRIKEGDKLDFSFNFKNTGKVDLVIKNVTASCGCAQPVYPVKPIKPGESGKIDVTYNSKGKMLQQKSTITVITNGSPRKQVLTLTGYVKVPMARDAQKEVPPKPKTTQIVPSPSTTTKVDTIK